MGTRNTSSIRILKRGIDKTLPVQVESEEKSPPAAVTLWNKIDRLSFSPYHRSKNGLFQNSHGQDFIGVELNDFENKRLLSLLKSMASPEHAKNRKVFVGVPNYSGPLSGYTDRECLISRPNRDYFFVEIRNHKNGTAMEVSTWTDKTTGKKYLAFNPSKEAHRLPDFGKTLVRDSKNWMKAFLLSSNKTKSSVV